MQKKNNEWYTPAKYIEAARAVMGSIDLDPASCELANQTVKATRYYTKEQNGLMQEWGGRMWINPPYGRINPEKTGQTISYQLLFVQKLLSVYQGGYIEQAVLLLLGNSCFMRWFQPLWKFPLCFHDGRISFYKPDGTEDHFGFGTIFVYLGPNEAKFTEVFSRFGRIVRAIDTPPIKPTMRELWEGVASC